jgi:DUF971 family protein
MLGPKAIEIVGQGIAVIWPDDSEDFLTGEFLRERSPSAENKGEVDILGQRWGGDGPRQFPGVSVTQWQKVGNYAVSFEFSDGHKTGIYSWAYLRQIAEEKR